MPGTAPSAIAKVAKRDATIRDLIKYTHADLLIDGDLPPKLWGMDVIIPGAVYTSSVEGASSITYSDVWGKTVLLLYVPPGDTTLDSIASVKIFRAKDWEVRSWREERKRSEAIEASVVQDEVVVSNVAGYLYTAVIS